MNQRNGLGRCPGCVGRIPRSNLLVEYERNERRFVFAECPNCREGVIVDSTQASPLDGAQPTRPNDTGPLGIDRSIAEIREVLGDTTELLHVGVSVLVDRPITIEEKRALTHRLSPGRMKNFLDRDEARIDLC